MMEEALHPDRLIIDHSNLLGDLKRGLSDADQRMDRQDERMDRVEDHLTAMRRENGKNFRFIIRLLWGIGITSVGSAAGLHQYLPEIIKDLGRLFGL